MYQLALIACLALSAALPAQAAEGDPDVLYIYGPPRNRVRTLAARVARQKVAIPIIIAQVEPASRPAEATLADLLRGLNRQKTASVRDIATR